MLLGKSIRSTNPDSHGSATGVSECTSVRKKNANNNRTDFYLVGIVGKSEYGYENRYVDETNQYSSSEDIKIGVSVEFKM